MNSTIFVVFLCGILATFFRANVEANLQIPTGMDQDSYCNYCEEAVKGIIKFNADKKTNWVEGSPCLERYFKKSEYEAKTFKKIIRTCNHLVDLHGDELEEASPGMNEDQLDVWLCHEKTYACLGLTHEKHNGAAVGMDEDEEIKKLLRKHKDRIKTPYPYHYKEEL